MKAGLIGFPGSGRDTVFRALTGLPPVPGPNERRLGEAVVEDPRLDFLSSLFKPKKHSPAKAELLLARPQAQSPAEALRLSLERVREADALIMVARNFEAPGLPAPDPAKEAKALEGEIVLSDYVIVERRLERLAEEKKKGKRGDPREAELLGLAKGVLERELPLRGEPGLAASPELRGFGLASAKPLLIISNDPEGGAGPPPETPGVAWLTLRGSIEAEIATLDQGEARDFLAGFGLDEPGSARVCRSILGLLDLICFFTVGEDECRAWTLGRGADALAAAGRIHSDIRKGFIRAEVVAFEDFKACGGFNEAKKKGLFRLEGKTYVVADGDIVHFRFNV
jgi:ribosome-binding ATPase YchF (GTP1/OBG family)